MRFCDRYRTTPRVCALTPPWLPAMGHTPDREEEAQHSMAVGVLRSQRPDFREAKTDETGGQVPKKALQKESSRNPH